MNGKGVDKLVPLRGSQKAKVFSSKGFTVVRDRDRFDDNLDRLEDEVVKLDALLTKRMFEKYQKFCMRPLNPPILGDFEPSSPQSWGARGAVRGVVSTF